MKKENADKWVAALRSGIYKQGTGVLKNDKNCFCCLGVLLDINGIKPDSDKLKDHELNGESVGCYVYDSVVDMISPALQRACDIKTDFGKYISKAGISTSLAVINDEDYSFEHIANVIEEHYDQI